MSHAHIWNKMINSWERNWCKFKRRWLLLFALILGVAIDDFVNLIGWTCLSANPHWKSLQINWLLVLNFYQSWKSWKYSTSLCECWTTRSSATTGKSAQNLLAWSWRNSRRAPKLVWIGEYSFPGWSIWAGEESLDLENYCCDVGGVERQGLHFVFPLERKVGRTVFFQHIQQWRSTYSFEEKSHHQNSINSVHPSFWKFWENTNIWLSIELRLYIIQHLFTPWATKKMLSWIWSISLAFSTPPKL